jgi:hypothetical protein
MARDVPMPRDAQVYPTPQEESGIQLGWRRGVLASRARDVEAMDTEQRSRDLAEFAGSLMMCVGYCLVLVLTGMGIVSALVAWVKFTWSHV